MCGRTSRGRCCIKYRSGRSRAGPQPGSQRREARLITVRRPALPASVCDRKRSISGVHGHGHLRLGMPEYAPCPPVAAGFCERAGGSRGAQRPRSGAAGALDAIVRERIMPGGGGQESPGGAGSVQRFRAYGLSGGVTSHGGRGGARRQPALPRSAGHRRCPGDMMIDWVSPACGDAAAQSNQAVRLALRGRVGSG